MTGPTGSLFLYVRMWTAGTVGDLVSRKDTRDVFRIQSLLPGNNKNFAHRK